MMLSLGGRGGGGFRSPGDLHEAPSPPRVSSSLVTRCGSDRAQVDDDTEGLEEGSDDGFVDFVTKQTTTTTTTTTKVVETTIRAPKR